MPDGKQKRLTEGVGFADSFTDILGFTVDGYYGKGVITAAREGLGSAIAADRAAANMFGNGFLQAGLVTPEEDIEKEDGEKIKENLDKRTGGWEHAGELAFVNRKLKIQPWSMTAKDAQFLESRQFSIEEIARWFGIPPFELMQTEKQTSWGTGIEAQQRGLARGNLLGWTMRIEEYLSVLLAEPRFCEFDFVGLERPTPEQEIRLLIEQVNAGLITVNEARKIRNLPPLPGGDELRSFGNPIQEIEDAVNRANQTMVSARQMLNNVAGVLK
jgi:HK97 family phage portal protein